ncbi:hypothetical protein [Crenobacter intestini]|uniref:Uncharacterized protein n=1 Tax=Crenobacter intestini TaxID=2563443 RepID=A0A4T0UIQ6_9NEIS|nr:hypothetical protein [Crenobacter intestini]TIC78422.1 hypothetical protein E5K04_16395 [Crenobacter intestini]
MSDFDFETEIRRRFDQVDERINRLVAGAAEPGWFQCDESIQMRIHLAVRSELGAVLDAAIIHRENDGGAA